MELTLEGSDERKAKENGEDGGENYNEERVRHYMEKALEQAKQALTEEEVPVGCVFVWKDEIVATGYNKVNESRNVSQKKKDREFFIL